MKNINNQSTFAKNQQLAHEKLANEEKLFNWLNDRFKQDVSNIIKVLAKYGATEIDWSDKRLEKFPISKGYAFRCYIKPNIKFDEMSKRNIENLEAALHKVGIPMPICPVSRGITGEITVQTVYSSEKYL